MGISEREETASGNFLKGYNCCQAVLLTFRDLMGMDDESILKVASGMGGGMARMREVCGCVSAMGILAGFISPAVNPGNMDERTANYALVQQLAARFREANGSIICRELLNMGDTNGSTEGPRPSDRTEQYYKKRPCGRLCGDAARIVARYIDENNFLITKKA